MQTTTHRRVVPVHSQVVVGQNVRRPVDILQRQRDGRHDALPDPGPGLAGGGGEEAGDVDVVMVVTVSVGVDLQPRPRPLDPRGEEDRHQQTPHESQHVTSLSSSTATWSRSMSGSPHKKKITIYISCLLVIYFCDG